MSDTKPCLNNEDDSSCVPDEASSHKLQKLMARMKEGELSHQDQQLLSQLLETKPLLTLQMAMHRQEVQYRSDFPPPQILNAYNEDIQREILESVRREQTHTHEMQKAGLNGAIQKDRRGQWMGFGIAIFGLGVASYVAQYSAWTAGVIGALDLVGLTTVFAAPRVLEHLSNHKKDQQD